MNIGPKRQSINSPEPGNRLSAPDIGVRDGTKASRSTNAPHAVQIAVIQIGRCLFTISESSFIMGHRPSSTHQFVLVTVLGQRRKELRDLVGPASLEGHVDHGFPEVHPVVGAVEKQLNDVGTVGSDDAR